MALFFYNPKTQKNTPVTKEYFEKITKDSSFFGAVDKDGNPYLLIKNYRGDLEVRSDKKISHEDEFFEEMEKIGVKDLPFYLFRFL